MYVGVEAGDICGEHGDGLGDGNELSRLCLGSRLAHLGISIVATK